MMMNDTAYILKVGGSLIIPDGTINIPYIKLLYSFVHRHVKKGRRFFVMVGGGSLSRMYINAAREITGDKLSDEQLDWLALQATHANGYLFRTIFHDIAHPHVITDYSYMQKSAAPVVIAAGWKPGHSTDYNAVVLAQDYQISTIIKLSNTDCIYDKDPRTHASAKPLKKLSWTQYNSSIGSRWEPGKHTPFDQPASVLAATLGVRLIYLNGLDIHNLEHVILNRPFKGTTIS